MKKVKVLLFISLVCCAFIIAQQLAITANGDTVLLNNDGTWEYVDSADQLLSKSYIQRFITIGTGGTAGTYFPLGGALATIWNKKIIGMNANATSTGASAANIAMLKDNKVDVIFVQNDAAFYAMNDLEMYKGKAMPDIRGMASLYDETCQVVTLTELKINTIEDLKGKRVSVGVAGSGVEANARQILEAAGLTYDDISVQYLFLAEAIPSLVNRNTDAIFYSASAPTAAIQDLANTVKISIVPIDGRIATSLIRKWPFYTMSKIPSGTYKNINSDVYTVTMKSIIAVSADADSDLVYKMLETMYESVDDLALAHTKGSLIRIDTAVDGMSIPLHAGAEKFFHEKTNYPSF